MLGSVHFGIIAACIVLFVPMGMAGWHLSRNKILFFSCALFITLAVGVHLSPYFPSVSDFVSSVVVFDTRESCINSLHDVLFDINSDSVSRYSKSWRWVGSTGVVSCEFQKLGRVDASDLLNGSWVVVAGDSQARLFVVSLLELVLGSERMGLVKGDLFRRHSDYRIVVDEIGMKLEFVWAPFEANLSSLVGEFKGKKSSPDVLVMGSGLWHMLRVNNASDYGAGLRFLRRSIVSLSEVGDVMGSVADVRVPHMFWLGMPVLVNEMLNTEEKKKRMTDYMGRAYGREVSQSKLLKQSGAGPFMLLDILSLTRNCGSRCTVDGMHYDGVVYEAAVQIMLNALLIESHQKL